VTNWNEQPVAYGPFVRWSNTLNMLSGTLRRVPTQEPQRLPCIVKMLLVTDDALSKPLACGIIRLGGSQGQGQVVSNTPLSSESILCRRTGRVMLGGLCVRSRQEPFDLGSKMFEAGAGSEYEKIPEPVYIAACRANCFWTKSVTLSLDRFHRLCRPLVSQIPNHAWSYSGSKFPISAMSR